eukprot:5381875-Prymnesium_polylepis.1
MLQESTPGTCQPGSENCHRPPLGWFESNEGGAQKLGRPCLDTLIITYSLDISGTCADSIA